MRWMDGVRAVAQFFVLVGALAWGLMAIYQVNVIDSAIGTYARIFYSAIGISGAYLTYLKLKFA